jgi:Flp pilus assembly protein TadD
MLELPQTESEKEIAIDSKEIPLNFDSRVARGLVVTVRALDEYGNDKADTRKISVHISDITPEGEAIELLRKVAKAEIYSLEQKRKKYPDSEVVVNNLASTYLFVGDSRAAIALLREAVAQLHSELLKHKLATALIEEGQFDTAEQLLDRPSKEWITSALVSRAYLCVRKGQIDIGRKHIVAALEEDYFDYSARLFAGALLIWEGAHREAIRCFKIASEERPRASIPLVHMAAAYFALDQKTQAITALRKATNLNPLDDQAVSFYCDLLFLAGKPEIAIKPLERLYDLWGSDTRATILDRLAKAYLDSAQHTKAIQILRQRLVTAPNNPSLLNNASVVLWNKGDFDDAKALLIRAAEKVLGQEAFLANDAIPVINLLTLLIQREEYSVGLRYAEGLLQRLGPQTSPKLKIDALIRYVDVLAGSGKTNTAAALAEESFGRLKGSHPNAYRFALFLLHYYSVVVPDKAKVFSLVEEAIAGAEREDVEDKLRIQCANNVVFSLLQFNEIKRASQYLSLLHPEVLKNPYATATYGLFYLRKGNFSKGKVLYDKAIQLAGNKLLKGRIRQRMALELAKEYKVRGDGKEALYWLERALNEQHGFEYARNEATGLKRQLLLLR